MTFWSFVVSMANRATVTGLLLSLAIVVIASVAARTYYAENVLAQPTRIAQESK